MELYQKDPHSPPRQRLIGAIENSIEFKKAFNCHSASDSKNKNAECRIW